MAQVIKKERIGLLSYGAGTITLAASILTIGGQQYTTGALNLTVPTVTAATRYMIYAVQTAGVVSLVQSTNVNSVGPAGYLSWKLVGAYYANGNSSPLFGSFVNIEGIPATDAMPYAVTVGGLGAGGVGGAVTYRVIGRMVECVFRLTKDGTPGSGGASIAISYPANMTLADMLPNGDYFTGEAYITVSNTILRPNSSTVGATSFGLINDATKVGFTGGAWTAGGTMAGSMLVPITGLSNTPIKDL